MSKSPVNFQSFTENALFVQLNSKLWWKPAKPQSVKLELGTPTVCPSPNLTIQNFWQGRNLESQTLTLGPKKHERSSPQFSMVVKPPRLGHEEWQHGTHRPSSWGHQETGRLGRRWPVGQRDPCGKHAKQIGGGGGLFKFPKCPVWLQLRVCFCPPLSPREPPHQKAKKKNGRGLGRPRKRGPRLHAGAVGHEEGQLVPNMGFWVSYVSWFISVFLTFYLPCFFFLYSWLIGGLFWLRSVGNGEFGRDRF